MMRLTNLINSATSLHFNKFIVNFYYLDETPVAIIYGGQTKLPEFDGLAIFSYPDLHILESSMPGGINSINELVKACVAKKEQLDTRFEAFKKEVEESGIDLYRWRSLYAE